MTDEDPPHIVHVAAQWLRVDSRLRQRCAWCGAVLIDDDLSRIARPIADLAEIDPEDPRCGVPTWETGGFVAVSKGFARAMWIIEPDGAKLPPDICADIDHDLTGHRS